MANRKLALMRDDKNNYKTVCLIHKKAISPFPPADGEEERRSISQIPDSHLTPVVQHQPTHAPSQRPARTSPRLCLPSDLFPYPKLLG